MSNQEPKHSAHVETRMPVFDACPHCGRDLSPWEKVLLGVDRALMCKHCWYRIILDPPPEEPAQAQDIASEEKP